MAKLEPMLRHERAAILAAKGFTEADVDPVHLRVIDGFIQAATMMDGYFAHLMATGGPVSAKGHSRRAFVGWSRAADRLQRFAKLLGLERRARQIETPTQWLTRVGAERAHRREPEDATLEPEVEP
jgi:uncharacterized protein (DUF2342 family)